MDAATGFGYDVLVRDTTLLADVPFGPQMRALKTGQIRERGQGGRAWYLSAPPKTGRGRQEPIASVEEAELVRAAMPSDLKLQRGLLMMFEANSPHQTGANAEVRCPGCGGARFWDLDTLAVCTLCCGFGEVPGRLSDWFRTADWSPEPPARRSGAMAPCEGGAGACRLGRHPATALQPAA